MHIFPFEIHGRGAIPRRRPAQAGESETDPERPRAVRSLALTSESLGLTATLDLAEISGRVATPIEYRKGCPKRVSPDPSPDDLGEAEEASVSRAEAWPTDRVQVGLQAILLEEAGYEVREAAIYYAGEKRRLMIPVDDALKAEALRTLEAAKRCAAGLRPGSSGKSPLWRSSPPADRPEAAMRRCCLVCYDIREPKRLRFVHKMLRGYDEPWQYSVFSVRTRISIAFGYRPILGST